ncbi:hydrogenase HycP [Sporichthya brevicatena]|uniref:Hydrogenase HycP n=1 Tax=Sporichthya brevicatena TaxID=171442 RepID=A0ABP3S461_9ACTN
MSGVNDGYLQSLNLVCGGLLLTAVLVLWRRDVRAIVRLVCLQGVLLAGLAAVLAVHHDSDELVIGTVALLLLKGVLLPFLLARAARSAEGAREAEPLINVPASLLAAALLTLLAYAASQPLTEVAPGPEADAIPVGIAMVLIGFLTLTTRRNAVPQVAGFLVLDNGIGVTALLATEGVPLVVELGAALDLLLIVLILQILTARLRVVYGATDLDELRELRD